MERRITLRDIAKKSGHHYSTVSLALRGDLRIPAATRDEIVRVANEMEYRRDPMVQALAAYRATTHPSGYRATLAWLVNDTRSSIRPDYNFRDCLRGAHERAEELGYKIDEFLLRSPGMTPSNMCRMLQIRGIVGILVAPQPNARVRMRIKMNWSPFAAVSLGCTLGHPLLHRLTNHHFRAAKITLRKLVSLGYRRIGLCVHRVWNGRVDKAWTGGYLSELADHPKLMQLKPLLIEQWDPIRIGRWIRTHRLDAVIVDDSSLIDRMADELHLSIPGEIGAAALQVFSEDDVHSGIDQNEKEIGRLAIDLLVGMLHTNVRGIPAITQTLLIEGNWKSGSTVRRSNPRPISSQAL